MMCLSSFLRALKLGSSRTHNSTCLRHTTQRLAHSLRTARQSLNRTQNSIKPKCSSTPQQVLTVTLGSSLSVGVLGLSRLCATRAECERRPSKNRLVGLRDETKGKEPDFPWSEFFKLLAPDVWYLLAAVVVS